MEKLNDQNFKEQVKDGLVLVDFYADWCGPCKMMHPVLEELENDRAEAKIMQINVDESPAMSKEYGVMSIPTLILFKDGCELERKIGFTPKAELVDWMNKNV